MILTVLEFPDERLQQKSVPVTKFDATLGKLLDDMAETMYSKNGIGLAAAQVGKFIRALVIDLGPAENQEAKLWEIINPKFTKTEGKTVFEEGCLSVPGYTEEVSRKAKVTVEYQDRHGKQHTLEADGLLAVALQHETDHLDGVLFIDRLSPLKRRMARKKLIKAVTL